MQKSYPGSEIKSINFFILAIFVLMLLPNVSLIAAEREVSRKAERINTAIQKVDASWVAGVNAIATMSDNEKKKLVGTKLVDVPDSKRTSLTSLEGSLPTSFDWRHATHLGKEGDWTTGVRDQGNCGSCWDFAPVGVVEMLKDLSSGDPAYNDWENLSEQKILSCCNDCGYGCNGGWPKKAFEYMKESGVVTEDCMPYKADDSIPCNSACGEAPLTIGPSTYLTSDVETIKRAIKNYGAVSASFEVYEDFYFYSGGVYEHVMGDYQGGHSVVLVGWGKTDEGEGYWIAKNSWSSNWGNDGWFKIKWGECWINQNVIMATLEDSFNITQVNLTVKGPEGTPLEGVDIFVGDNWRKETDSNGEATIPVITDLAHTIIAVEDDEPQENQLDGFSVFLFEEIVPTENSYSLTLSAEKAPKINVNASKSDGSNLAAWLTFHREGGSFLALKTTEGSGTLYSTPGNYDLVMWNWPRSETAEEVYKLRKRDVDLTDDRSISFNADDMPTVQFKIKEFPDNDAFSWYEWIVFWDNGFSSAPIWRLQEGDKAIVSAGELLTWSNLQKKYENNSEIIKWKYWTPPFRRSLDSGQVKIIQAGGGLKMVAESSKKKFYPGEEARVRGGLVDNYGNKVVRVSKEISSKTSTKMQISKLGDDKFQEKFNDKPELTTYSPKNNPIRNRYENYFPTVSVTSPSKNNEIKRQTRLWSWEDFSVTSSELGEYGLTSNLFTHLGNIEANSKFSVLLRPDVKEISTTLPTGWSMFSIPGDASKGEGTDPQTVLGDDLGSSFYLYRWNTYKSGYEMYPQKSMSLYPEFGQWVKVTENSTTIDAKVKPITSDYSIHFDERGWYQIGNPYNYTTNWEKAKVTCNGTTKFIQDQNCIEPYLFGWNSSQGGYIMRDADPASKPPGKLSPWHAYWLFAAQVPAEVTLSSARVPPLSPSSEAGLNPNSLSLKGHPTPPALPSLKISDATVPAKAMPNPVTGESLTFKVSDSVPGVEEVRVEVFAPAGNKVYDSGFQKGRTVTWNTTAEHGSNLANGLYLFKMKAKGEKGEIKESTIRKLFVLH